MNNDSKIGNSDKIKGHRKTNNITFHLFLESLAITAMMFRFDEQFKELDKLLYLVERMNQSKGINKSQMRSGKTLYYKYFFKHYM
jgi:hypothetical protein